MRGKRTIHDPSIGWYMDGHLPWRLFVLEEAAAIVLKRMQEAQRAVSLLPKVPGTRWRKDPERRLLSEKARDLERTYQMMWQARDHLAPPSSRDDFHRFYTGEEQMNVFREARAMGEEESKSKQIAEGKTPS